MNEIKGDLYRELKESGKIPESGNSTETLEFFEKLYCFNRNNNIIYFITNEIENVKLKNQPIRVKVGRSETFKFQRRWQEYTTHTSVPPYLLGVISIPAMPEYKTFLPHTDWEEIFFDEWDWKNCHCPYSEEKRVIEYFKDRTYIKKSKEKLMLSINEIEEYIDSRQGIIEEVHDAYITEDQEWRYGEPLIGPDGKHHNKIIYHRELLKLEPQKEEIIKCLTCNGSGVIYKKGKYGQLPNFFSCEICKSKGKTKLIKPIDDKIAWKKSLIVEDPKTGEILNAREHEKYFSEEYGYHYS